MFSYWLGWAWLTILKAIFLASCIIGAIGGCINVEHLLLAIIFIPASVFLLYDFIYQVLVPFLGGVGNRCHKPSDTPMYMGLAPSWREAQEELKKGHCIIWD